MKEAKSTKNEPIVLNNEWNEKMFSLVLDYFYEKNIVLPENLDELKKLTQCANYLGIDSLLELCQKQFWSILSDDNFSTVYEFARDNNLTLLSVFCNEWSI